MADIIALYGSPRKDGNSAALLQQAVAGAREEGAWVDEVILREHRISPCLEIYHCIQTGECAIKDDFAAILKKLEASKAIMLASPIFFYTVSAHTKIFMDRCQSLWVRKYWIEKREFGTEGLTRKGLFLSVGATAGDRLFDGALLTVRYFFDVIDTSLWRSVLCRGVDRKGEMSSHPEYLARAREAGRDLARELSG